MCLIGAYKNKEIGSGNGSMRGFRTIIGSMRAFHALFAKFCQVVTATFSKLVFSSLILLFDTFLIVESNHADNTKQKVIIMKNIETKLNASANRQLRKTRLAIAARNSEITPKRIHTALLALAKSGEVLTFCKGKEVPPASITKLRKDFSYCANPFYGMQFTENCNLMTLALSC